MTDGGSPNVAAPLPGGGRYTGADAVLPTKDARRRCRSDWA
ncbi:hypothetical protein ABZW96_27470 [Nocardia sp. NPDC004168]